MPETTEHASPTSTHPEARKDRRANLRPAWTSETARAAALRSAAKASQRVRTRQDAAQIEKDARAYLVAHLPQIVVRLVQQALENPDGSAMREYLLRALPKIEDGQRSPLILSGIKLELGPEGATITMGQTQLPQAQDVTVTGSLCSDRREPEIAGVPGGGAPGEISAPGYSNQACVVEESQPPA